MVRQAQIDRCDRQGGDDQRAIRAGRHRCGQQGRRRRYGPAGTRAGHGGHGLCHGHHHGLGCRSAHRRRKAAARREGRSGPRFHGNGRDRQRGRCLARLSARSCLCQCPAAADLDAQSCPHDPLECCVGRAGTERPSRCAPLALWQDRGKYAVPAFPPYRGCRPHARRRPDRRGQIGVAGADGAPVPPLRESPGLRLRLRRLHPSRGARHGRELA